jgi:hypothetical protein
VISVTKHGSAQNLKASLGNLFVGGVRPPEPRLLGSHKPQLVSNFHRCFAMGIVNKPYKITAERLYHFKIAFDLFVGYYVTAVSNHFVLADTLEEKGISVKQKAVSVAFEFSESYVMGV